MAGPGPPETDLATADLATADLATVDLATADLATADLATADLATADLATARETVDPSTEHAFFERSTATSERPVSLEVDAEEAPLDFEGRELRRGYFKRVVGCIIATMGFGSLLAFTRPGPPPPEPLPITASPASTTLLEPAQPSARPVASAWAAASSIPPARVRATTAAARVSTLSVRRAPTGPRVVTPLPLVRTPPSALSVNRSPPTARFPD
jgi:hypothetical protein